MRLSGKLEEYRLTQGDLATRRGDSRGGCFFVPGPCGEPLVMIADNGENRAEPKELLGWEHVSVSTRRRLPNWIEMCFVKDLFWTEDDWVIQFHPPKAEYVNNHPFVLHLWRPADGAFPTPPSILVGVKEVGEFKSKADAERAQKIADEQVRGME